MIGLRHTLMWPGSDSPPRHTRKSARCSNASSRKLTLLFQLSNLKPGDVLTYIIKQKEARSGYAANKDRKNLVAAWNWGMKYMNPPLPGPNPCLVDRMPEVREPRYVPPEEDFWKVYDQTEGQNKVMLLTLLHLAARKGEIFRLTLVRC